MIHFQLTRGRLVAAISAYCCFLTTAGAADVTWVPTGTNDYNVPANWSSNVVPELTESFQDVAVIANGSTSFVEVAVQNNAGTTVNSGVLEVRRGGSLLSGNTFGATGNIVVGSGGTLRIGGLTGNTAASFTGQGAANLSGITEIIGPNANLTAASFSLQGSLRTTVTAGGSSALTTTGNAQLAGTLQLSYSGVTPTVGSPVTVVNAGSISGDGFTSVTTSSPLPAGHFVTTTQTAGGNGTLVQAAIQQSLYLEANRRTGNLTIVNSSTSSARSIDSYLITSPSGALVPGSWNSLVDQGLSQFTESNPSALHLGELSLSGSTSIAANGRRALGAAYVGLGAAADLAFSYRETSGTVRALPVQYVGPRDAVMLIVDPTGEVFLQNQSSASIALDGYQISSASDSLIAGQWNSFASGNAAWTSANPTARHLGELRLSGATNLVAEGEAISLGSAFLTSGTKDLVFTYHVAGGVTVTGQVVYDESPFTFVTGDYNYDGMVNASDYATWKSSFGSTTQLSADGNKDGVVDLADYTVWRDNLGAAALSGSVALSSQAVPEPSTLAIAALAVLSLVKWRQK
ncbi:PEP-CTERM sorting domain-containing protein [Aeoliella sp. SH292]|uniref:PEP-CTERM sorting domain-containing protein n=1 Tax=Aeoliella sp. SH292 TaxID=3454464 RepID=UPI003F9C8AA9